MNHAARLFLLGCTMSDSRVSYCIELHGVNITADVQSRTVDGITTIDLTTQAPPSPAAFEDVVSPPLLSPLPLSTAETP